MIGYLIAFCENRYLRYKNLWLRLRIAYVEWQDAMQQIEEEVKINMEVK